MPLLKNGRARDYAWRRVSKLAAAIGDEFIERVCSEEKKKLGDLDKRHAQYCAEMEGLAEAGE